MAGRPRTFDSEEALDAAIDCFWLNGYHATTTRDLAAGMGMTGASMYNAFGDKRALFLAALARYLDRSTRRKIAALEQAADPVAALKTFFAGAISASLADRRGCLLINSAVELARTDPDLDLEIRNGLQEIRDGFQRSVLKAQRMGRIAGSKNASDIANILLASIISIRVLSRTSQDKKMLHDIADAALGDLRGAH